MDSLEFVLIHVFKLGKSAFDASVDVPMPVTRFKSPFVA